MKLAYATLSASLLLCACSLPLETTSEYHVSEKPEITTALTPPSLRPVRLPAMPPTPVPRAAQEVFSVVVSDVPVKTLLFALARDNKLNIDIHPSIGGRVTLNATDQTLPQLLERIASQSDIRYEINGDLLRVEPNTPYLRNYAVDYVNLLRQSSSNVGVSGSLGGSSTGGNSGASDASIRSTTDNRFWDTLVSNVCQIVITSNQDRNQRDEQADRQRVQEREDRLKVALELTKALQPAQASTGSVGGATPYQGTGASVGAADLMRQVMGSNVTQPNNVQAQNSPTTSNNGATFNGGYSGSSAANGSNPTASIASQASTSSASAACGSSSSANNPLMVNKESGIIGVNTTSKGHERVRAFLDKVMAGARRQVLIEATVVEVQLSANSQSGINWTQIVATGKAQGLTVNLTPSSAASSSNAATISYNKTSTVGSITAAITLLESFGKTKVLSSPKLSVINNQTAILKVIDNYVYVTLTYTPATFNATTGTVLSPAAYNSNINTIPVGFVMNVTPQISDSGDVTLNVHPSITRVINTIVDPNPALLTAVPPIVNLIPVVQSRELESILRVQSGEIAVLGGLMQESDIKTEQGIPGINRVSILGDLTGQRSDSRIKTELVIFLRPVVINDASINGDYKQYKSQLPDSTFFNGSASEAWGMQK